MVANLVLPRGVSGAVKWVFATVKWYNLCLQIIQTHNFDRVITILIHSYKMHFQNVFVVLLRRVAKDVTPSLLSWHKRYDFNAANFQCHSQWKCNELEFLFLEPEQVGSDLGWGLSLFLAHGNINVRRTIVIAPSSVLSLSVAKNFNLNFHTHHLTIAIIIKFPPGKLLCPLTTLVYCGGRCSEFMLDNREYRN